MTNSLSLTGSAPSLGSSLADTSAANTYTDINGLASTYVFAGGLGMLGFVGRGKRRKQNAEQALAAA